VTLQKAGRLGRKGGAGFYLYPEGGKPTPDPEIAQLVEIDGSGGASEEEIVDRCVLALLNEACLTLDEGVIDSPLAGDLAIVLGTGFAPFRGGIFRYADARGVAAVVERLEQLAAGAGERFRPAPRLRRQAGEGKTFYPDDWPHKIDSLGDLSSTS
jgi:3-hydroxyacyl-CoA dehydrogenase